MCSITCQVNRETTYKNTTTFVCFHHYEHLCNLPFKFSVYSYTGKEVSIL